MKIEFKSAITRGGKILTPQRIEITENAVTLKQRNKMLIGIDRTSIPRKKIASIEIDDKVWGVDIYIYSLGKAKIVANNFTLADAKRIKSLLSDD